MHFSRARKIGSDGCRTAMKMCRAFLASLKKLLYLTQIQLYLSKYHHIFTRYSCIYPMSHCICLKISPNNTIFASNIITKPHKMHFSHSYKGLGKCTFLELCTMHFYKARTTVHLTVIARMVARTFLKTPALARLGLLLGISLGLCPWEIPRRSPASPR